MKKIFLLTSVFLFSTLNISYAGQAHKFLDTGKKNNHQGKTRGYIHITLTEVKRDENKVYLRADVLPQKDLPNSTLEWQLPRDLKVDAGSEELSLNLQSQKSVQSEISVNLEELKDKDKIFFFAYQLKDGERLGASVSYTFSSELKEEVQAFEKSKTTKEKKKYLQ